MAFLLATLLQMYYLCTSMSSLFKINLDFAGFAASFICAIHCISMPILLSIGMVNSGHFLHNHTFDTVIIIIGICIAAMSLFSDYKMHKSKTPLTLIFIGFTVLIFGLKLGHDLPHILMSVVGSIFVASAHIINWKKGKNRVYKV